MKSVRYQAEFFSAFYDASYLQRIEEVKVIQDILGQRQDQVVLRQFLESALKADLADVLPTINRAMQQDEMVFWQHWQPLQQRYLAPDFRASVRSLLTTPTGAATPSPQSRKKSLSGHKPAQPGPCPLLADPLPTVVCDRLK